MLFEQGPRLSPSDFEHDELKYWFLGGISNDVLKNPQTFRSDPAREAERVDDKPPLWYARTLGGTSVHFTANYWRFHEIDFDERSRFGSIAGTGFADWPITLRRARAVLHEGRMGDWRVRSCRRESVRSAAHASPIRCRRCR